MIEQNPKLVKLFENLNKNLYRTNKIIELYNPLSEILSSLNADLEELDKINKKEEHLHDQVEIEIKKRELISLYKKMQDVVCNIKEEVDYFYNQIKEGDELFEKFRSYRTYIFETPKKSQEYLLKLTEKFNIDDFILKFNVVGTVDLNEVADHIKGKKIGIDIIVPKDNLYLIYEEILKSKSAKFRLIANNLVIYFEKDNILRIEAPSKKIKLCDITSKEFDAKLLEN
jgi:hypothetical protein